ncbi:MAG: xylulose kinase, partial [Actinobacteria bacterium]
MSLVLGIDSSTQATTVEVRDADTGKLVASGRNPHPPTTPPRSEQDPTAWWEALEPLLRDDVGAVSVAAQQHGLVALDDRRALIRPAKLWNDTESAADAGWLLKQLGGAVPWAAACGSVPVAAFTITKLSWLHRTEPDAFARLAHVLLPHDWLTFRLAGELVTDRGDASGTGYWSPAEDRWRFDLLGIVDGDRDWEPMLPRVLGPTAAAGEWRGAVVGPGTGDNMAAALGIGMQPGDVAVSIGTSGTVFAVSDRPTN